MADIASQITQGLPSADITATTQDVVSTLQDIQSGAAAQSQPGVDFSAIPGFGNPGFDERDPIEISDYSKIANAFADAASLEAPDNPQKMSFSSETPALAQPSTQIDPILFNAMADDPSLLNTDTYDQSQRNLSQATTVGQFKSDVQQVSTDTLENTYFKNFDLLNASGAEQDGPDVASGPAYLTGVKDVMNSGTDTDYVEKNPSDQAKAAGAAPSDNQIPLMLGAFQHPNFANADPAIKNINVSAFSDSLVDDATKIAVDRHTFDVHVRAAAKAVSNRVAGQPRGILATPRVGDK